MTSALIFANRKTTVREVNKSLQSHGFRSSEIHGDMEQPARIAEFDRFKNDEINILVASDVAARGLDVKGVSHVINFDVPWQPDDYIHRIGRTGRAGLKGISITLATREDSDAVAAIEKLTGLKIAICGDVAHSRVARSNIHLLTKLGATVAVAEKVATPRRTVSNVRSTTCACWSGGSRGSSGSSWPRSP